MEKPSDVRILVLTDSRASAEHWAKMLSGPGTVVWLSRLEIPPSTHPDVLVTDRDLPPGGGATGVSPVHGQDARISPVHGQDARISPMHGQDARISPMHGQDARGTHPHGQDARGTHPHGQAAPSTHPHGQDAPSTHPHGQDAPSTHPHGQDARGTHPEILPGGAPATLVGVVKIGGGPGRADVALPNDVTARELRLACRLLAQIVRLRRREKSAAERHRRLTEEALTDPLTGLPNRRAWQDGLEERLALISHVGQSKLAEIPAGTAPLPEGVRRASHQTNVSPASEVPAVAPVAGSGLPRSQRLCVAVLDLDHFKQVNDAHGHAVGDEVLRAAGRAIRESLRQDDFVARLGGDEFGLLLWVPDEPTAASVVDRIRAALPLRLVQATTRAVTASAGYHLVTSAESPEATFPADTVYGLADAAMHEAKRLGRDRTVGKSGAVKSPSATSG